MKQKDIALPKGISIKGDLYKQAQKKADELGISFSQLVTFALKKELKARGDFTIPSDKPIPSDNPEKKYSTW